MNECFSEKLTCWKNDVTSARVTAIRVGGLVPITTTDFPDRLAAVIFTQGCPWDCHYCHNPHLLPAFTDSLLDWDTILGFLETRRGLLDAVVFSGGEPLYQRSLLQAVETVHGMGFEVGLHTGGAYPERLRQLLPRLDWVGLDIKALFRDYGQVTRVPGSGERARISLDYLLGSGIAYEVRTTVHSKYFDQECLLALARDLRDIGVRNYALQVCRKTEGINAVTMEDCDNRALLMNRVVNDIDRMFSTFTVRGM